MDNKEIQKKYQNKAKESFNTKLDLFLFKCIKKNQYLPLIDRFEDEFNNFEITDSIIEFYISKYWAPINEKDYVVSNLTINEVNKKINKWKTDYEKRINDLSSVYLNDTFEKIFPIAKFKDLLSINPKCYYCGIDEEKIKTLIKENKLYKKHITRGWSMEIDRKEPNKEYSKDNSVICCYWCNNAKTDEFTADEFKEIGKQIKQIWENRLNK